MCLIVAKIGHMLNIRVFLSMLSFPQLAYMHLVDGSDSKLISVFICWNWNELGNLPWCTGGNWDLVDWFQQYLKNSSSASISVVLHCCGDPAKVPSLCETGN